MTRSRQKSKAVDSSTSELNSLPSRPVSSSSNTSFPILDSPSRTNVSTDSGPIHPESTLQDLPLHRCIVELSVTGAELAVLFQRSPQVPGAVILNADGSLVGVVIRSVFFELMLDGVGNPSPFLQQPLQTFSRYVCSPILKLSGDSGILVSAKRALRRISKAIGEPILVNVQGEYLLLDFHTLNIAYWQIRGIETQLAYEQIQIQMIRNDKMASLGRLVNGVSHEILDPVSFIWGNLSHLSRYVNDVIQVVDRYELELPNPSDEMLKLRSDLEIDYLREDIPKTLQSIKTGADRLTKLASSLQNFCHIDEVYPKATDIHDCLDSVLLLLKSHLKNEINVEKSYGALPTVPCFIGQVTQVFLNILSYLIRQMLVKSVTDRVLEELPLPYCNDETHSEQPQLRIMTEVCSIDSSGMRWISVRLGCNGEPISLAEQQQLINDFTYGNPLTRESSLVMAHRVVTKRHQGILRLRTADNPMDHLDPGISTEFEILMPLG